MSTPIVIMVGGPATGKTTLGRRIAQAFQIPFFGKDGVKEPMFDHIGYPRTWSDHGPLGGEKMDDAAISILLYLMEEQSRARTPCVIDTTFQGKELPRLKDLQTRCQFLPIQIHCVTEPDELGRRYRRRAHDRDRHPGHLDHQLAVAFDADALRHRYRPLDLGGPVHRIDTTRRFEAPVRHLLKLLSEQISVQR